MKDKPFWKSKEVILGALIVAAGVARYFGVEIPLPYLIGALGLDLTLARIRQGNAEK